MNSGIKRFSFEDIARTLAGIYFAAKQNQRKDEGFRLGFAAALSSVALAVGVNPESFLSPEDIQLLKRGSA